MYYAYLFATLPLLLVWTLLYVRRKDLRQEMLSMSFLLGFLSVVTSYYWWTIDWWRPLTVTGTKVGIEDFLMGFFMGGIIAIIYEVITTRRYSKNHVRSHGPYDFWLILLLLAQTTSWLFYGIHLTSFYASSLAMLLAAGVMLFIRRDLIINAMISGACTALISMLFYATALLISSSWVSMTYLNSLSGVRVSGVPIEEFIFWFLAGLVFGPFYEFWKGLRLKKLS